MREFARKAGLPTSRNAENDRGEQGEHPFVSVIIPVYNDAGRIASALEPLLEQTYPHDAYEIVAADNGSIDTTLEVVNEYALHYPDRIRVVRETEIQSSYAARNRAVGEARGEILAFTDSDCIPERNWIEAGVRALDASDASSGGGRIEFFFTSDRPNIYEHFDAGRKLNQEAFIEQAGFAATANFFARRKMFDRHGPFRHDLISGGDFEFGRRLTSAGEKMVYIPDAVIRHPARASLHAILKKSRRVAEGERQLEALGLYEHKKASWRQLLPVTSSVAAPGWNDRTSLFEKVGIVALWNLVRWVNYFTRLRSKRG